MQRIRIIGVIAVLALVAAACSGGEETPRATRPPRPAAQGPAAWRISGRALDADPALVEKALGPVEPSDEESWNIILASIARAEQDLDQATIDKAMECWNSQECDTGHRWRRRSWATPTAAATRSTSGVR